MTKLTNAEREELKASIGQPHREPALSKDERFVADTPEARMRYIEFTTQAAKFYKGEKPVGFKGNNWKL